MDVHFCDLCNESVPERDLEQGRAFLRKGRVVCASCDQAMGGALAEPFAAVGLSGAGAFEGPALMTLAAPVPARAPAQALPATPAAPAAAGGGLALALATLAILLTASGAVLVFERLDEAARDAASDRARERSEQREELDGVRALVASGAAERSAEAERLQGELAELVLREERRAQAAEEALAKVAADLAALAAAVDADAGVGEEVERHAREAEAMAALIVEMRGDIGVLAQKLRELELRPAPEPAAAAAPPAAAPPAADATPAWTGLLAELKSASSGARWSAVQALRDTRDPAVVPHLIPMLKDSDIFVRMATARVLGDLAVMDAVPHLIDALEDEEASVREQALVSLRELTGKDFKFDPTANEADRAKKVKAWRDWWKREGDPAAAD